MPEHAIQNERTPEQIIDIILKQVPLPKL